MKKRTILWAVVPAYLLGFAIISLANSSGPASAVAGSPLENGQTCTNCHAGTVNSGSGDISVDGLENYVPGQTYILSVQVNGTGSSRFGFQAVMLDGSNQQAGSFNTGNGTKKITANGASYIEHSFPSTNGVFSFEWVAPAAGTGDVTLYVSANASNGNGNTSGDEIYKNQFTVSEEDPSSVASLEQANGVTLYPMPATSFFMIDSDGDQLSECRIYTLGGALVHTERITGDQHRVETDNLSSGQYIVEIDGADKRILKKIIIQ